MDCPFDRRPLAPRALDHATCFVCGTCSGRAITVPLLRRMMPAGRFAELWSMVRAGAPADAPCPSCARAMRLVEIRDAAGDVAIDGCAACQVIWFRPDALRALVPDAESPAHVLDAPVPGDGSDGWVWKRFFRTLNEKLFTGASFPF